MVLVDFRFSPLVLYKRKNLPQARITVPVAFIFPARLRLSRLDYELVDKSASPAVWSALGACRCLHDVVALDNCRNTLSLIPIFHSRFHPDDFP